MTRREKRLIDLCNELAKDRVDYNKRSPMNIDEVTQRSVAAAAAIRSLLSDLRWAEIRLAGYKVKETNIFDSEETIPNCTVQILRNSVTGEVSVGWYRNLEEDDLK